MMDILFWVFVGMMIGWHVPAPVWATKAWEWVKSKF